MADHAPKGETTLEETKPKDEKKIGFRTAVGFAASLAVTVAVDVGLMMFAPSVSGTSGPGATTTLVTQALEGTTIINEFKERLNKNKVGKAFVKTVETLTSRPVKRLLCAGLIIAGGISTGGVTTAVSATLYAASLAKDARQLHNVRTARHKAETLHQIETSEKVSNSCLAKLQEQKLDTTALDGIFTPLKASEQKPESKLVSGVKSLARFGFEFVTAPFTTVGSAISNARAKRKKDNAPATPAQEGESKVSYAKTALQTVEDNFASAVSSFAQLSLVGAIGTTMVGTWREAKENYRMAQFEEKLQGEIKDIGGKYGVDSKTPGYEARNLQKQAFIKKECLKAASTQSFSTQSDFETFVKTKKADLDKEHPLEKKPNPVLHFLKSSGKAVAEALNPLARSGRERLDYEYEKTKTRISAASDLESIEPSKAGQSQTIAIAKEIKAPTRSRSFAAGLKNILKRKQGVTTLYDSKNPTPATNKANTRPRTMTM